MAVSFFAIFPGVVLIESYWNLKHISGTNECNVLAVLIESYWNLKTVVTSFSFPTVLSINRIILEFKGAQRRHCLAAGYRINRIILEFKVLSSLHHQAVFKVLIESYWNLKGLKIAVATCFEISINRIILEFKGERREVFRTLGMCINRIILEFKARRH